MKITQVNIECEGNVHGDIAIDRIDGGARITHVFSKPSRTGTRQHREVVGEVMATDERDARFAVALKVAGLVYGLDPKRGGPMATNSMVHDVMNEIERIAGC